MYQSFRPRNKTVYKCHRRPPQVSVCADNEPIPHYKHSLNEANKVNSKYIHGKKKDKSNVSGLLFTLTPSWSITA